MTQSSDENNPCTPVDGPQCPEYPCDGDCQRPGNEDGCFIIRTQSGEYIGLAYEIPRARHDFVIHFSSKNLVATEATQGEAIDAFIEHLGLPKTPGMRTDPPDPLTPETPFGIKLRDQVNFEQGGRR